jgi:hypothetical protein
MDHELLNLWASIYVLIILIVIIGFSLGYAIAFTQYWLFI